MLSTSVTGRKSLSRFYRPASERMRRKPLLNVYSNPGPFNAILVSAEVATTFLTLVFDRPVYVGTRPTGWRTNVAVDEVGVVKSAADTIVIEFSGSVAAATDVFMPTSNNGIRTADGGFGIINTFPVGA